MQIREHGRLYTGLESEKGLVVPSVTEKGAFYWASNSETLYSWNGSSWVGVGGGGGDPVVRSFFASSLSNVSNMPPDIPTSVAGVFMCPDDYLEDMVISIVYLTTANTTGDVALYLWAGYDACGESSGTKESETDIIIQTPNPLNHWNCVGNLQLVGILPNDIVYYEIFRRGENIGDTYNANISVYGVSVTYTATG